MNSEQIVAQEDALTGDGQTLVTFDRQPSVRMLPVMPILIVYHPTNVSVSFEKTEESVVFTLHGDSPTWPKIHNCIDAHQLRAAFLSVRTLAQALNWIAASGHFRSDFEDEACTQTSLAWSDFQLWQEFVRLLLGQGFAPRVKNWDERSEYQKREPDRTFFLVPEHISPILDDLSDEEAIGILGYPEGLQIAQGSLFRYREYPHPQPLVAEMTVWSALEAVLATVYVDRIAGTKFRVCALQDCSEVYEVSSKHERQYCSQAHAHKASVRKRRAEAKKLKEAAAQQTTKSKGKKGKG